MASKTILRNISGVDDVRVALDNSTLRRALSIGSAWNKIRVAVRFSLVDPGVAVTSTPQFALGVCSGATSPFNNGSATTTHFVGARTIAATWSRTAGTPPYLLNGTYAMQCCKRVGTTITAGSTHTLFYAWYIPAATNYRGVWAVDITKGSPNFSMHMFGRNNPTMSDVSKETFLSQIGLLTPTIQYHNFEATIALAVNEGTEGALDHVNISWDRSSPKIEISDLAIVRLS